MRLSMQDKNEFLKAAVKAGRARDLDGLTSEPEKVTRLEVIEADAGRAYVRYGVTVELAYQDGGRTLKVFVREPMPDLPPISPILPVPMGPAPDNGIRGYPVPGRDAR